jgi:sarcosine oxidase gamma subunit
MNAPLPLSPIHDALPGVSYLGSNDAAKAALLSVADLSQLARTGVKGPGAANWLAALGLPLPATPNSWLALAEGGLIARLGNTEYLIEASPALVGQIMQAPRTAGVYPVLRQDACLRLTGSALSQLLLQTCNVNFADLDLSTSPVVLTSMAGVGVTVLPEATNGSVSYRVWCDGTYGIYLWQTLCAIAQELGGGAVVERTPR